MAIIRFSDRPFWRHPWDDLEKVRNEMDKMFRGVSAEMPWIPRATVYPALNVSEDEDNIYVRAEIPGVKPEDLDISIEGETLTLKGERQEQTPDKKFSYHRHEIETGRFSRALALPTRIDSEKIEASYRNGIIKITLPKAAEVKPKKIGVSAD